MRVGDRILAIDGESLCGKTVPEAVAILHRAGDVVNLKISKASRRSSKKAWSLLESVKLVIVLLVHLKLVLLLFRAL